MLPTGDELREALTRQQPSADFTARVMQQVRAERKVRRFPLRRWSIVGAIAASLLVGIYVRQQRRAEIAAISTAEAAAAEEQILGVLRVAGWQVHRASEAAFETPAAEDSQ